MYEKYIKIFQIKSVFVRNIYISWEFNSQHITRHNLLKIFPRRSLSGREGIQAMTYKLLFSRFAPTF